MAPSIVGLAPNLRVRQLVHRIHDSIWLFPTVGVVLGVVLSRGLVALDRHLDHGDDTFFFDGGPESARELLSTVTSSMLTFTALVFSITILVLQLASNQFSPRAVRTFLEENITKLALGTFVGTFVYAVSVLSQVRADPGFVPAIATWVALGSVLVSVGVFIRYIHQMTHSIRAISVITKIAAEARDAIERMFPDPVAHEAPHDASAPDGPPDHVIEHTGEPAVITFIDADCLLSLAHEHACVVQLVPKVGDFVPTRAPLLWIWGESVPDDKQCRSAIAFDIERTIEQDPAFGLRQLVDIALRALSPSTNDPSTAVQALDHIHDLLRRLTTCSFPSRYRADDEGELRIIVNALSYRDYVQLALDEIRANTTKGTHQVWERLQRLLEDCVTVAGPEQREVLEEQQRLLARVG
jgi:uncharacterized membrane protein